jgi:hypothetical protein
MPVLVMGLIALLVAAGCGSLGKSSSGTSPFSGHWAGPWADTASTGDHGTMDLVVGTDGKLTGTDTDTTAGRTGPVTGVISSTGAVTATVTYPGMPAVSVTGTVAVAANGHLAGAVQSAVTGQTTTPSTFDLVKQ